MGSKKKLMLCLMCLVVWIWGLDSVMAKKALTVLEPLTLLFFKYCIGVFIVLGILLVSKTKYRVRKQDIPIFLLCCLTGEIGYFFCEYTAMDYLPVSLITIVLSLVPAFSIIVEALVFKRHPNKAIIFGVCFSIVGVSLIIGTDFKELFSGRLIGYLLAFSAMILWVTYNFITSALHRNYSSFNLTLNQITCTLLLIWPYALTHLPAKEEITLELVGGVVYLGIFGAGVAFTIMVKSIDVLGVTPTALFSNFLPITAAILSWLILGESMTLLQMAGGAIVIASGYVVIKEKGRLEEIRLREKGITKENEKI